MSRKRTRDHEIALPTRATDEAEQSVPDDKTSDTDAATEAPAWRARVEKRAADEVAVYELTPGTWFARQHPRTKTATARDIERMGHRVARMAKIGVIRMVESKSEQDA